MYFRGQNMQRQKGFVAAVAIFGILLCSSVARAQSAQGKRPLWIDRDNHQVASSAPIQAQLVSSNPKPATGVRYSAQGDFSATQNPNGVWSYGYEAVLGGAFTRYALSSSSGFIGWFGPVLGDPGGPPGFPLIIGPTATNPPLLNIHPSPELYSVLRWTAPASGRWDVVGDFAGTGLTTTDVHILRNGVSLLASPLNNSDSVPYSMVVTVNAGDMIDFAVGPGPTADSANDSTNTRAVIAPHLYDFAVLDYPGATSTQLSGINDSGDVVGFYTDAAGNIHGFLYSQGRFRAIDYPSAVLTEARGINNLAEVIGLYDDNSNQPSGFEHGFILRAGQYTRWDFPGAADTDILGLNDLGDFAGSYDLGDINTTIGFLTRQGQAASFEVPGSAPLSTVAMGVNDLGQVAGYSADSGNPDVLHGFLFLRDGSTFTAIDYPGANFTVSAGINELGNIVGRCLCIDSRSHGLLWVRGVFTVVDFPIVDSRTRARGINNRGQIVGLYQPGGGATHGFIATPAR